MAGWAGALGDAILGGNNAFLQAKQRQKQDVEAKIQQQNQLLQQAILQAQVNDIPNQQNFRRSQQANELTTAGLNQKLLQDKVNELPQQHAEGDFGRYAKALGDDVFDSPQAMDSAARAGFPFQTKNIQLGRVQGIESGQGGPVPTTEQQAQLMGVAPHTGAVIPSEVRLKQQKDQQAMDLSEMQNKALKSAFGAPGQGGGFELGPDGAPLDTPKNRQLGGMLGANDPITRMYGAAGQSPANVAARKKAEVSAELDADPNKGTSITSHVVNGKIVYTKKDRQGNLTEVQGPQGPAKGPGDPDANTGGFSDDGLELAATAYRLLKSLPARDKDQNSAIISRAAAQSKALGQSPVTTIQRQAVYKADTKSLERLQLLSSTAEAANAKALGQAELVSKLSSKVGRTWSPLVNEALLSGKAQVFGDQNTTLLYNAVETFTAEYGKIMEGSTGSVSGSTDSARKAAARLIKASSNDKTLQATIEQMKYEMKLALDGYDTGLATIRERMGSSAPVTTPSAAPTKSNIKSITLVP